MEVKNFTIRLRKTLEQDQAKGDLQKDQLTKSLVDKEKELNAAKALHNDLKTMVN